MGKITSSVSKESADILSHLQHGLRHTALESTLHMWLLLSGQQELVHFPLLVSKHAVDDSIVMSQAAAWREYTAQLGWCNLIICFQGWSSNPQMAEIEESGSNICEHTFIPTLITGNCYHPRSLLALDLIYSQLESKGFTQSGNLPHSHKDYRWQHHCLSQCYILKYRVFGLSTSSF